MPFVKNAEIVFLPEISTCITGWNRTEEEIFRRRGGWRGSESCKVGETFWREIREFVWFVANQSIKRWPTIGTLLIFQGAYAPRDMKELGAGYDQNDPFVDDAQSVSLFQIFWSTFGVLFCCTVSQLSLCVVVCCGSVTGLSEASIHRLIDWWTCSVVRGVSIAFFDWLIDWLIDWLVGWSTFWTILKFCIGNFFFCRFFLFYFSILFLS